MTKLKIKVTKEILERSKNCGIYGKGHNCAVALAVRDIFPDAEVGRDDISPFGSNAALDRSKLIRLPHEARGFIMDFDESSPAERASMPELEFEINIPDHIIEKINIEELRPLLINHKNLELV